MGEIKYNGRTYSGLIQANGCFVDTSNVLLSATAFVGSYSYTATEDCFVCFYISPRVNDDTFIQIDGENVETWWRSSVITDTASFYVRKGQTISVPNAHASNNSYIWVYGLLQSSPITFLSEYASACYDTNEREVGCWIDGKPIYEITVDKSSNPVTINTNWAIIVNIPSIKRIIRSTVLCGNKMEVKAVEVNIDNSDNVLVERVGVNSGDTRQLTELMIQYTKTTD